MHVHTAVEADPAQVRAVFRQASDSSGTANITLSFDDARTPPKFRVAGGAFGVAPSAELMFDEQRGRVDVILRLMWGPLPAPFPRAVALVGVLAGAALTISTQAPWALAAGLGLALAPLWALFRQRRGERELQTRIAGIMGAAPFVPRPH